MSKARTTIDDVRRLALALPEASEKPCYGTPGFYVRKVLFARILDDDQVVVKVDFDQRDAMLEARPEIFSVTAHYMAYPMVIVALPAISPGLLDDVLFDAWRSAAPAALSRHLAGERKAKKQKR